MTYSRQKYFVFGLALASLLLFTGCGTRLNNAPTPALTSDTTPPVTIVEEPADDVPTMNALFVPGGLVKSVTISDQPPNDCHASTSVVIPSTTDTHAVVTDDGHLTFFGDVYLAVELGEADSDTYIAEWFIGDIDVDSYLSDLSDSKSMVQYVKTWRQHSKEEIASVTSCDGKRYVYLHIPSPESGFGVDGTWLEPRKVVLTSGDTSVWQLEFYLQQ